MGVVSLGERRPMNSLKGAQCDVLFIIMQVMNVTIVSMMNMIGFDIIGAL